MIFLKLCNLNYCLSLKVKKNVEKPELMCRFMQGRNHLLKMKVALYSEISICYHNRVRYYQCAHWKKKRKTFLSSKLKMPILLKQKYACWCWLLTYLKWHFLLLKQLKIYRWAAQNIWVCLERISVNHCCLFFYNSSVLYSLRYFRCTQIPSRTDG